MPSVLKPKPCIQEYAEKEEYKTVGLTMQHNCKTMLCTALLVKERPQLLTKQEWPTDPSYRVYNVVNFTVISNAEFFNRNRNGKYSYGTVVFVYSDIFYVVKHLYSAPESNAQAITQIEQHVAESQGQVLPFTPEQQKEIQKAQPQNEPAFVSPICTGLVYQSNNTVESASTLLDIASIEEIYNKL